MMSDKVSTFLGSFVKESSINDFYKFNFVPYDKEGFTIEGKPWPTLVILRYNQQTGVVEIYTVSTSTTISQQYENTNTQQLTIENIVKLENETEYTKRTSTPNVSLKIIGTPTTLILGMKPDEGQSKFDEYSRKLIDLINAANKTDYHLTRLHVYLPKSETGFFQNMAINFFRKPKPNAANQNAANPNEISGKSVTKTATKFAAKVLTTAANKALGIGGKSTRHNRRQFKKCTRRIKYTKKRKTHKMRH